MLNLLKTGVNKIAARAPAIWQKVSQHLAAGRTGGRIIHRFFRKEGGPVHDENTL